MSRRIDLENKIYARAAYLHAAIHSKFGGLNSSHSDGLLQALICIYNAFFQHANWAQFCAQEDSLEGFYLFHKNENYFHVRTCLFLPQEYKIELLF